MKRFLLFFFTIYSLAAVSQPRYHTYNQMTSALKAIVSEHSSIASLTSLGKTLQGRDIWLLALRKGDPDQSRAMLIVGGVEASSLAGSEMALQYASDLADQYGKTDSITALLAATTLYILPRVSPDASESYFQKPLRERTTNYRPTDDDHDGAIDEDDAEDLDNDGVISLMRIKDPRGEWMPDPGDPRLLKKADASKGERGVYSVHSEGIDNDKDEQWNEDGAGGVDFNRNFAHTYEYFGRNAGVHPVSEFENRAVADFIFAHHNIAAVFTFSSNDNLTSPWKSESKRGGDDAASLISSVLPDDEPYFATVGQRFLDITQLKNAPKPAKAQGSFSEWVYFHTGRWSFAARPWWPAESKSKSDTARKEKSGNDNAAELTALRWYESAGYNDVFIPWKKFKHPDFPERDVEIGGLKPFVSTNPPSDSLLLYCRPFESFFNFLAAQLPSLAIANEKCEALRGSVYRISLDVVNNGFLPTNSAIGEKLLWSRDVSVTVASEKGQTLLGGKNRQQLKPVKGNGGYLTLTWLIAGSAGSIVTITADSPMAGKAESRITLR